MSSADGPGFVDNASWPKQLTARVITPEPPHRLHGYQIVGDLMGRYSFGETLLLALTGTPPGVRRGRMFEAALQLCAPLPIQEAPTHAAALAAVSGARSSNVIATAAVALCERARREVDGMAPVLAWLDQPEGPPPEMARALREVDERAVEELREMYAVEIPALKHDLTLTAAAVALFHSCGLRDPWQLETALVLARLGLVAAEAWVASTVSLRDYPINLPRFDYQPGR